MAKMDLGRMLDALLGGAAIPLRRQRRRRRTTAADPLSQLGLGGGARGRAALGRTLATLAGVAIEALSEPDRPAPPPPRTPDLHGGGTAGATRRLPETGPASPWSPTPAPEPPAAPESAAAEDAEALLLVRAMIAAAKADGSVDAEERGRIAARLDAAGLSAEERDFVLADFDSPLAPEALAAEARDPMLAAQLYAAAVAAAGEVAPAERAWLDRLAAALRLDRAAAAAIEARLSGKT